MISLLENNVVQSGLVVETDLKTMRNKRIILSE